VLISGNEDKTVRSWTLDAPFSAKLGLLSIYSGHTGPVKTVACAHSGDRIISGSEDAEIAVWEGGKSNRIVWKIRGHDGPILSISVSGEEIFSSSEDKTIRVWALDTGVLRIIIPGHTAPINSIRLSHDGQWILSASDDARLKIWDTRTGKPRRLPQIMSSRILSVAVSRDSKQIVCGGADGKVHVWCPDLAHPEVWPDSFIREVHGLEYCPIDDQGILANATLRGDGWLCGSTGEAICWIPPDHRSGLLQRTVGVLGAPETALDMRNFVHGTDWDRCAANFPGAWAAQSHQMLQILL
jgi:WD40 repeat protein